jgi:superoxide dismutase, Fe-Mn family
MFWNIMKPHGGGDPTGPIAEVIKKTFGDFKPSRKNSTPPA